MPEQPTPTSRMVPVVQLQAWLRAIIEIEAAATEPHPMLKPIPVLAGRMREHLEAHVDAAAVAAPTTRGAETCQTCNGRGLIEVPPPPGVNYVMADLRPCPDCGGTGKQTTTRSLVVDPDDLAAVLGWATIAETFCRPNIDASDALDRFDQQLAAHRSANHA